MMEAVRTSETSDHNHSTLHNTPQDSSEHHIRRRENFKSEYIFAVRASLQTIISYFFIE
jgi:hypothetical protein